MAIKDREGVKSTQEGFLYEENAYKALQKYKISTGGTAGASHDKPDLTIQSKGKTPIGCELKNSPTAAGSLVMKYYNNKWDFGEYKGEVEMRRLADILGSEVINNQIEYNGKKINYYSETEMFHVDRKKFETAEEVVDYLEGLEGGSGSASSYSGTPVTYAGGGGGGAGAVGGAPTNSTAGASVQDPKIFPKDVKKYKKGQAGILAMTRRPVPVK